MINELWFVVVAFMLTGYAVLDGFDLGVGALHLVVGRDTAERSASIDAIGPVWNGNEVWLIATGGALVAAFPPVYASGFSGFYLALVLVLWLLLLRGVAIEFRHQWNEPLWHEAWDVVFAGSSASLAVLFGVAVGNLLRGLPLDASGQFQGSFALMLNPFALLGGVFGLFTLALHGACWLAYKTEGAVQRRARALAGPLFWVVMALLVAVVASSFVVRPDFTANFARWPWLVIFPLVGLAGAALLRVFRARGEDLRAFLSSSAFIAGTLASVAAGLFPRLLPAMAGSPHPGLDVYNSASAPSSLRTALFIYLFAMTLVGSYLVFVYRVWRGKATTSYA